MTAIETFDAVPPTTVDDTDPGSHITQASTALSRLMHTVARFRAQLVARAEHDAEWSATLMMLVLVEHGPMRSSALAEAVQSDPSTVSRAVASLVADGVIERQPDPSDGRASLLVPTEKARSLVRHHREVRDAHMAGVVADWDDDDVATFATLMARFAEDFETYKCGLNESDRSWSGSAAREGMR